MYMMLIYNNISHQLYIIHVQKHQNLHNPYSSWDEILHKNATRGELHSGPRVVFNDWGILKHSLFSKGSSLFRFY